MRFQGILAGILILATTTTAVAGSSVDTSKAKGPSNVQAKVRAKVQGPVDCASFVPTSFCGPQLTLVRFAKIDTDLYRGSRPHTRDDMIFLKAMGIRTILTLDRMAMHVEPEEKLAGEYGINVVQASIQASPLAPSTESVNKALEFMRDKSLRPLMVHCLLGRDRTSLVSALYKVFDMNEDPDQARQEQMLDYGLKPSYWFLEGLIHYYDKHAYQNDN